MDEKAEYYRLLLEHSRQREQDILKLLGFLLPAIGGYGYILLKHSDVRSSQQKQIFVSGTVCVEFILAWGAFFVLVNSFHYRSLQLVVERLQEALELLKFAPHWGPSSPNKWLWNPKNEKRSKGAHLCHFVKQLIKQLLFNIAPEIYRVQLYGFICSLILVCSTSTHYLHADNTLGWRSILAIPVATLVYLIALELVNYWYCHKLYRLSAPQPLEC
jgi:hypothetical protein